MGQQQSAPSLLPRNEDPLLIQAIKSNDLLACKQISNQALPSLLQEVDTSGYSGGHWAAFLGNVEILKWLNSVGFPLNDQCTSPFGFRPIHCAVIRGHIPALKYLIEVGCGIESTDSTGSTPLIVASQYGFVAVVNELLSAGANVFHIDNSGDTAVHWACYKGNEQVLRCLLAHTGIAISSPTNEKPSGFDLTLADGHGQTALHLSALRGHSHLVMMLHEMDSRPVTMRDSENHTPLQLARGKNHTQTAATLESLQRRTVTPTPHIGKEIELVAASSSSETPPNSSPLIDSVENPPAIWPKNKSNTIKEGWLRIVSEKMPFSRQVSAPLYFVLTRDQLIWFEDSTQTTKVGDASLCDYRALQEEERVLSLMPLENQGAIILIADDEQERDNWFAPVNQLVQAALEFV
eukprot:c10353_g1_i2.p1 GENE.c10353_g1_i2~~c10353_g1_i2.p1  ORF type:complete len:417 (-),score=62.90 c10353_g1_i2:21-1241(-)